MSRYGFRALGRASVLVVLGMFPLLGPPAAAQQPGRMSPLCRSGCGGSGAVAVTPDGSSVQVAPNTSGLTAGFFVKNTGSTAGTWTLTCSTAGPLTCQGVDQPTVSLDPGEQLDVQVTYASGAPGSGTLTLTATGPASDPGSWAVTVAPPPPPAPPRAVLWQPAGDNGDRAFCLTAGAGPGAAWRCGELVVAHGTPAYATLGRERSLTLLYTSSQADPMPSVHAAVTLGGSDPVPSALYAELQVNTGGGFTYRRSATWNPWGSPGTAVTRVIGLVDPTPEPTGAWPFRLIVRAQAAGGATDSVLTGTLLVVNRVASPSGRGWALEGVEQVARQTDGALFWWGGDGSARRYAPLDDTTWLAPAAAYRDTLHYHPASGTFSRTLRHGIVLTYNAAGRQIATTTRAGQVTTFWWDAGNTRVDSLEVPPAGVAGTRYRLAYDANGHLAAITDPAGRVTTVAIDAGGTLTALTDPDGLTTWFGYTAQGQLASQLARRAASQPTGWVGYQYGLGGHLTQVAIPLDSLGATLAVTGFEPWDEKDVVPEQSSGNGAPAPTALVTTIRGPRPNVADDATFVVDRWGAPTQITDPLGRVTAIVRGDPAVPALATQVTLADGSVHRMTYDGLGNLLELRDSTAHLPNGQPTLVTQWVYASPQTAFSPSQVTDPAGLVTTYAYNHWGLDSLVTAPDGHVTAFEPVASGPLAGLVRAVVERQVGVWDSATASLPVRDLRTAFGFNALGNVVADTSPMGRVRTALRDGAQRVTDAWDPAHHHTSSTWDPMNRLLTRTAHTEEAGVPASRYPAEALGPLTTTYTWQGDQLASVSDPRQVVRQYRYDWARRLTGETDDYGLTETRWLNAAGQVDSLQRRSGARVRNTYDPAGRLLATTWPTGTVVPGDSILSDSLSYAWDAMDRPLAIRNRRGAVTRTYDAAGRLTQEVQTPIGLTVTSGYDAAGRRIWRRSGPAGNASQSDSVSYAYDGGGRVAQVRVRWRAVATPPPAPDSVRFTWDGLGRRQLLTYSNGLQVWFAYDADGAERLLCASHTAVYQHPDILRAKVYQQWVDEDGLLRRTTGLAPSPAPAPCPGGDQWNVGATNTYSWRHALVAQTIATGTFTYQYDGSGNPAQSTTPLYSYRDSMAAGHNRLLVHRNLTLNEWRSYRYTADGARDAEYLCNPTQGCGDTTAGFRRYLYNGAGQPMGTLEEGCVLWPAGGGCGGVGYQYLPCLRDAVGRLAAGCENGGPGLGYDGEDVVRTGGDGANLFTWSFVHGPGTDDPLLAFWPEKLLVLYFITDGQGRLYVVGDRDGNAMDTLPEYVQQGGRYAGAATAATTFQADRAGLPPGSGLAYFRNRYYDQQTGRWTQEDPLGAAGGLNLYQFNGNNPASFTDPFGLDPCKDSDGKQIPCPEPKGGPPIPAPTGKKGELNRWIKVPGSGKRTKYAPEFPAPSVKGEQPSVSWDPEGHWDAKGMGGRNNTRRFNADGTEIGDHDGNPIHGPQQFPAPSVTPAEATAVAGIAAGAVIVRTIITIAGAALAF